MARNRFGTFPLSTRDVPEADRIRFLRDELGHLMRLDVEALPGVPFHADLTLRILPGLGVISGRHAPCRVGRSRALIADGNDDLVLLVRTGAGILLRRNEEIPIGPGESILLSNADVGACLFSTEASVLALSVPRAPLKLLLGDIDASHRKPVPRNDALRLLESYLSVMGGDQALTSPELHRMAVAHVHDLIALAIGTRRDIADQAGQRSLPVARLRSIKADIANCLHRGCAISVGELAARQRVTPRYVQMLFEGEGTTFTQFVLAERLARAHRMLTNPNVPDRGIAAVAFDAGFGDLSYFIRSFRRAYGARPSDIRCRAAAAR
ncbi:helix-turn-helix transcriptional regulator [Aestuariivirga sp. YIM B02566]|uniref:Helix-turn-helix transcriptional regulator n=1 Tax=Taklimakanibacter albus TaxID=2800327 RepID=A0ACC5REV1_9HYPH|nr:AraC family transcriptional regulator [Aestuariivirga sp. YIM B02566]MBK1871142.1 helix-turn-helix transcriptional regulator [Aestuariivirga sp. YIM B02566]